MRLSRAQANPRERNAAYWLQTFLKGIAFIIEHTYLDIRW
jgi:hypothetical protein